MRAAHCRIDKHPEPGPAQHNSSHASDGHWCSATRLTTNIANIMGRYINHYPSVFYISALRRWAPWSSPAARRSRGSPAPIARSASSRLPRPRSRARTCQRICKGYSPPSPIERMRRTALAVNASCRTYPAGKRAGVSWAGRSKVGADRFAAEMLPIIEGIRASGVTTLDGIASALNTRGVRTARGGASHALTVRNVLKRDPKKRNRARQPVHARCRFTSPFIDSLRS